MASLTGDGRTTSNVKVVFQQQRSTAQKGDIVRFSTELPNR